MARPVVAETTDNDDVNEPSDFDDERSSKEPISAQISDRTAINFGTTVRSNVLPSDDDIEHVDSFRFHDSIIDIDPRLIHGRPSRGSFRNTKNLRISSGSAQSYPADFYTLMAINGPKDWHWSLKRFYIFMLALIVVLFQVAFFTLLLLSETDPVDGTAGDNDNPDSGFFAVFIPANASKIVRLAQIASILAYVLFPESTLLDAITVFQLFPRTLSQSRQHYPVWCMGFSCTLRLFQSILGMIVVCILIMTSETVIEIILNFTAVNFISDLDEIAFSLAEAGVFGSALKNKRL